MAKVRFRRGATQPFVGRAAAAALLMDAYEQATVGAGSVVFVTGEPGIGKTRLVEEFAERVSDKGGCVSWGTCRDRAGAPAFWPWVQVIRSCREQGCAPAVRDDARLSDALALLDDPDGAGVPVGEQARFRLFDSMATLLSQSCAEGPLAIVLDDLHWADLPSLQFLCFLVPELRGHPILVVGTYRDEEIDPGSDAGVLVQDVLRGASTVALPGLLQEEVADLLTAVLGDQVSADLVETVHDRSGGNPLFVGEMARLLLTRGVAESPVRTSVPDGIRAVIAHRLARQSQGCIDMLAAASVLGEEFDVDLLEPVAGHDRRDLLQHLDEASRARLVMPRDPSGRRHAFAHALVREVLYDDLPLTHRIEIHGRAMVALEAAGAADDERVSELALHAIRASAGGRNDQAVDYCARAGRRALGRLAYEHAVHHFHGALDALGDTVDADVRRIEVLLGLGEALLSAGDVPSARDAFSEAAARAQSSGRPQALARAALGFGAGLGGFEVRLWDDAQLSLLEMALADLPDPEIELRARLLARLSVALSLQEPVERRRSVSEEAIDLARLAGDPVVLAQALASRCDTVAGPGSVHERREAASEIVALSMEAADPAAELLGRRLRAVALMEAGEFAELDTEIGAFAKTADLLGQPVYSWFVPLWRGLQAMVDGRLDEVEGWTAEAERIGALAHSVNAVLLVQSQRSCVEILRGDFGRGLEVFEEAIEAFEQEPLIVQLTRPAIQVMAGDDSRWRRTELTTLMAQLPLDSEWLEVVCHVGEAAVVIEDLDVAGVAYEALLPYANLFPIDGIGAGLLTVTAHRLGCLAAVLGREDAAQAHLESAVDIHRESAAPLFLAESLRELGRLRRDDALLAEADSLFGALGVGARAEPAGAVEPPGAPRTQAVFHSQGDSWVISYEGEVAHVRGLKGMHDLATLLAAPGREVAAVDLVGGAGAGVPSEGLGPPGHAGEVLDAEARRQYEDRIRELQADIEEAEAANDRERAAQGADEMNALVEQLAAGVGLGGRPRRAGDPVERARTAVTWRIRKAIAAVTEVHPVLGRHLARSVRTGTFCAYDPEQPVSWTTD